MPEERGEPLRPGSSGAKAAVVDFEGADLRFDRRPRDAQPGRRTLFIVYENGVLNRLFA